MRRKKAVKLALNILVHSKLRTWLTVIGIVIGVSAVVAIISIGEGMQQSVTSRLTGLGADIITISPGGGGATAGFREFGGFEGGGQGGPSSVNLTEKDIQALIPVQNIAAIEGEVTGNGEAYYLGEKARVSVKGVDATEWKVITTSQLQIGRFLTESDYNAVVIGSRIANSTFKQPLAINRMITIENKTFKIVGILKASGGFGGDDRNVIMPIKAARDTLDLDPNNFNSISIKASSNDAVDQVVSDADSKLTLLHHVTNPNRKGYSITSAASVQETLSSITSTITLFLGGIAAISLLVGGIGIANSMFTSVLEKTREIGIMKAIGAKNGDILTIFVLSSAMIGAVGGVIGIALGVVASSLMSALTSGISITGSAGGGLDGLGGGAGGITTAISPQLLIGALLLAMAIGVISGIIPSYRASKLKPVDALRYE
jgi:putative ABC transport system permease protein